LYGWPISYTLHSISLDVADIRKYGGIVGYLSVCPTVDVDTDSQYLWGVYILMVGYKVDGWCICWVVVDGKCIIIGDIGRVKVIVVYGWCWDF
jgi:hypothetical protein